VAARGGFSYVDLVVTVLLIGVLAGITTPRFSESLSRHRARAAAARIEADLKSARHQAISKSVPMRVRFFPKVGIYRIGEAAWTTSDDRWISIDLTDAPYHVSLEDVSLGQNDEVLFDIHGRPDRGGAVTVRSGTFRKTVTIDLQAGEVTVP
jgi:Tfp pilus assembly protein FimT